MAENILKTIMIDLFYRLLRTDKFSVVLRLLRQIYIIHFYFMRMNVSYVLLDAHFVYIIVLLECHISNILLKV